jgi:hypothetical protein
MVASLGAPAALATTLLTTLLIAPLLLYLPGLLVSRLLRLPGAALEQHYERVIISVLLSGWLALTLAEVGIFSLWLQAALLVLLCIALALVLHRRASAPAQPAPSPSSPSPSSTHPPVPLLHGAAWLLVGGVALLLVLPPFETVLGVRDAGVYANAGFAMARTGSLVQHSEVIAQLGTAAASDDAALQEPAAQALSNFLGVQNRERFIATRLQTAGFFIHEGDVVQGRIVPQHLHLTAAWIGLLTSVAGRSAGLFAPGLLGVLGAWSVGMLGRQLAGNRVGLLAFLLLALNSVQVWFARSTTSETTAQLLIFAGFYLFARFQMLQRDAHHHAGTVPIAYAALAGVAFGQLALNRIDFVLVVVPLLLYLGYCAVAHRWSTAHTALALAAALLLLHAALHVIFIARAYVLDTAFARLQDFAITSYLAQPFLTPVLREVYHTTDRSPFKDPWQLWREVAALVGGIGVLLALWRWPQPLHWLERVVQRWHRWLINGSAIALLLLASYAYLLRPQILVQVRWPDQFARYEAGINALLEQIAAQEPPANGVDGARLPAVRALHSIAQSQRYAEALIFQQRLMKNIELTRRNESDNAELAAERAILLQKLDRFALATVGTSFDAVCDTTVAGREAHGILPIINAEPLAALPTCLLPQHWNAPGLCMRLQGYIGAPIELPDPPTGLDAKYMIPLANFVRFGWYLSPLGVVVGVVGLALWWQRGFNRASWFFLVVALLGTFFFIRDTYGTSDQSYIYILRRFVPMGYPLFSLGMAYALMAPLPHLPRRLPRHLLAVGRWGVTAALIAFFAWTGRPVYAHVEYGGALQQLGAVAQRFDDDDVLLFRGGGPTYHAARDVPDVVVTPLHFGFGLHAFTVKSSQPAAYADALAAQVRTWQAQGRAVYVVLSASGGSFALPGFGLEQVDTFTLHVPEFEQLTNQKPRNVAQLRLPFAIYRLTDGQPGQLATLPAPLTMHDFAAQVQGFYIPEAATAAGQTITTTAALATPPAPGSEPRRAPYAWTNGDALLRIPWHVGQQPRQFRIHAAAGKRPPHLGTARLCLALQPETGPWSATRTGAVPLGCTLLHEAPGVYHFALTPEQVALLPPAPTGSVLLHLESDNWVPAEEDPQQHDWRTVGAQIEVVAYE